MTDSLWLASIKATALGAITCLASTQGLAAVHFGADDSSSRYKIEIGHPPAPAANLLDSACTQIEAYLHGELTSFDLPLDWRLCSDFQQRVLVQTCTIPYGQVRTYAWLAQQIGQPGASRAVGAAEAANPLPIVVPCHRVISTHGRLGGYSGHGGVKTKAWLLQLEGHLLVA